MRCCAGHSSTNSPRSPRRKPQPRWMCRISEWDLYWVSTADPADTRIDAVGQGEVDDAELAAKRHCRLGAPVCKLFQPAAASAGQNQGQGLPGQTADKAARGLVRHE